MYVSVIKDIFFLVDNYFDVIVGCFILFELVEELSKRTKEEHPLGVVIFADLIALYYVLRQAIVCDQLAVVYIRKCINISSATARVYPISYVNAYYDSGTKLV
jgi:hypothetical protein